MNQPREDHAYQMRERGYDPSVVEEAEASRSIEENLTKKIKDAFAHTPFPGSTFEDISASEQDEGIFEHFTGRERFAHTAAELRCYADALSFFTLKAYRYWLPTFMIAELSNPQEADIIADYIASGLSRRGAHAKVSSFSDEEIEALMDFLHECIRRYPDDISSESFRKALSKIG
ncbi:MAG: hypothetical protein ACSHYB_02860 [Roseibacillus sp.]